MIQTKYVVIQTFKVGTCFIENNVAYDDFEVAIQLRDLKRKVEEIEKKGHKYNVASFNLIINEND
jgi:hypothetical protein